METTLPIAKLLARYGIRPTKRLGQHFLVDRRYLDKIVQTHELDDVKTILEVGPGPGNLTERLLQTGAGVLAVEVDARFVPLLNDRFAGGPDFTLCQIDILQSGELNPRVISTLQERWEEGWALVSNLPYQVATTVIVEVMYLPIMPKVMCVTIQKEVARRLLGRPGSKDYSALTVLVQSFANVQLVCTVPAGAFWPRPAVDSATVKIVPKRETGIKNPQYLRRMVNLMFRHRRKTLRSGFLKVLPEEQKLQAEKAFQQLGTDPSARAEQLEISDFIGLSNTMLEQGVNFSIDR